MKFTVTYTKTLTMSEVIEAETILQAEDCAEERANNSSDVNAALDTTCDNCGNGIAYSVTPVKFM